MNLYKLYRHNNNRKNKIQPIPVLPSEYIEGSNSSFFGLHFQPDTYEVLEAKIKSNIKKKLVIQHIMTYSKYMGLIRNCRLLNVQLYKLEFTMEPYNYQEWEELFLENKQNDVNRMLDLLSDFYDQGADIKKMIVSINGNENVYIYNNGYIGVDDRINREEGVFKALITYIISGELT
ncbi:hypothetical protein HCA68_01165 [Listeria booriae]|uniref:hypothetical protein n=1 Tax=Listeria booriae TaxID=1552123 RepID=UPI00162A7677|nr:hypothetical protein [Listeria booriae]MBC1273904.1 hypothetical protein [Listeria booriae]MBC1896268.1 hypothetical protein [Listeria booriae]